MDIDRAEDDIRDAYCDPFECREVLTAFRAVADSDCTDDDKSVLRENAATLTEIGNYDIDTVLIEAGVEVILIRRMFGG